MKKPIAFLCSLVVFAGTAVANIGSVPVLAQYTQSDLESAILSAASWTRNNNDPIANIGTDASDIAVTAFDRAGIDYDYGAYLDGLDAVAEKYTNADPITSMQLSLMAVSALGGDVKYFGGRDLAGDSTYYRWLNSVEEYSGALMALDAGDIDIPADTGLDRAEYIKNILSYQRNDGSFGNVRQTALAVTALSDDYNSTEYAVTYADGRGGTLITCRQAIDDAMGWLSTQQGKDGDFYSLTDTAAVSLAMDSLGVGQNDERFVKDGKTVMDGLLTYQAANGGFSDDYNNTDALATAYALSAMVSNARALQNKAEYLDFKSNDTITLNGSGAAATAPRVTSAPRPASRATTAPRATTRPTTTSRPRTTAAPRTTARPSATPGASGAPRITPTPTQKPALVGPTQIVGPIPTPSPTPEPFEEEVEPERGSIAVPIVIGIIGVLAVAAAVLIFMAKKKLWIFNKKENTDAAYRSKNHRRTEGHRHYEERRKFEDRRKYTQRGKYK